jgi:hypothetical protein
MEIPRFEILPGRYTEIKFYDNEVILLIKALRYYQGDYPTNSWTRNLIARLEKEEFLQEKI